MRFRVVISGIISGIILCLYFYTIDSLGLKSNLRAGEPIPLTETSAWFTFIVYTVLPWLILFIFGWVAARWNWSRTWSSSFLSGAGSGLIAGALLFCYNGVKYIFFVMQIALSPFSIADIELSLPFLVFISIFLLIFGDFGVVTLFFFLQHGLFFLYWICCISFFIGFLFGALGGLASMLDRNDVWGKPIPARDPRLVRLSIYYLVVNGLFNAALLVVVASLTDGAIIGMMKENIQPSQIPSDSWFDGLLNGLSQINSILATMFLAITPSLISLANLWKILSLDVFIAITWGWTLSDWAMKRKLSIISWLWLFLSFLGTICWLIVNLLNLSLFKTIGSMMLDYQDRFTILFIPNLISFLLVLLVLWIAFLIGKNFKHAPPTKGANYVTGDWLGYLLTCAVLGSVQTLTGIIVCIVLTTPLLVFDAINGAPLLGSVLPELITVLQKNSFLVSEKLFVTLLQFGGITLMIIIINMFFASILFLFSTLLHSRHEVKKNRSAIRNTKHSTRDGS